MVKEQKGKKKYWVAKFIKFCNRKLAERAPKLHAKIVERGYAYNNFYHIELYQISKVLYYELHVLERRYITVALSYKDGVLLIHNLETHEKVDKVWPFFVERMIWTILTEAGDRKVKKISGTLFHFYSNPIEKKVDTLIRHKLREYGFVIENKSTQKNKHSPEYTIEMEL